MWRFGTDWWLFVCQGMAEKTRSKFFFYHSRLKSLPQQVRGFRGSGFSRESLLCLVQETQGVVIAERNFATILALVIFWIHIDRA